MGNEKTPTHPPRFLSGKQLLEVAVWFDPRLVSAVIRSHNKILVCAAFLEFICGCKYEGNLMHRPHGGTSVGHGCPRPLCGARCSAQRGIERSGLGLERCSSPAPAAGLRLFPAVLSPATAHALSALSGRSPCWERVPSWCSTIALWQGTSVAGDGVRRAVARRWASEMCDPPRPPAVQENL